MNAQPLRALIWKDMRLNRTVLILSAGMILFAYLVALAICVYLQHIGALVLSIQTVMEGSIPLVLFFAALGASLVVANIVAGEYADRSALFLAYQPPSRRLVLLSKIMSSLLPWLVLTAIGSIALSFNPTYAHFFGRASSVWQKGFTEDLIFLLSMSWFLFSGAWCVATISRSVAIGVGGGIALPLITAMAVYNIDTEYYHMRGLGGALHYFYWTEVYVALAIVLGTLLFVAATIILLRRKEA
jgi:ABC-type transport system involved in multi-copper enzyme maturation permease subunit